MIRNGTVLSFDTGNYCWVSVVTASTNIRPPRLPLKQRRRLVTSMSKLIRYRFASDSLSRLDSSSYTHSACPDPVTRVSDDGRSADMELLRGCIYEFHSWTSLAAWHMGAKTETGTKHAIQLIFIIDRLPSLHSTNTERFNDPRTAVNVIIPVV